MNDKNNTFKIKTRLKIHILCSVCEETEYLAFKPIDCMYNEEWNCKHCGEIGIPIFVGIFEHQGYE